jgi:hypothetical protein
MARTAFGKNNDISATASGRTYVSSIIHLPGTVTEYRQTAVEASMARAVERRLRRDHLADQCGSYLCLPRPQLKRCG